jgi:hypothetical protein
VYFGGILHKEKTLQINPLFVTEIYDYTTYLLQHLFNIGVDIIN